MKCEILIEIHIFSFKKICTIWFLRLLCWSGQHGGCLLGTRPSGHIIMTPDVVTYLSRVPQTNEYSNNSSSIEASCRSLTLKWLGIFCPKLILNPDYVHFKSKDILWNWSRIDNEPALKTNLSRNWKINSLRLRQNGRHFTDDIFKSIFLKENVEFGLKFHWSLFPKVHLTIFQHWFR